MEWLQNAGSAPPTLRDVAAAAGVSLSTASKALNDGYQLRETTRRRVQLAAASLGFVPNYFARGLQGQRTRTVGLLTSDLDGRFSLPVLRGAEDYFGLGDVSVFLCDARGDAMRERHHVNALLNRRVDGLIIVGDDTNTRQSIGACPVPVVYAYSPSDAIRDCSVLSDNVGSGQISVAHLLALGRRRIGYVAGRSTVSASIDRIAGATAALQTEGLNLVGGGALFGDWEEAWGRSAVSSLFAHDAELDGVICGNDVIARGVLDGLQHLRRSVPEDVSVVGHDDISVVATQTRPQLTTIDMNLESVGRRAAELLSKAIDGDAITGIEYTETRLITRGSTALRPS